jgi:hypothetical protein
MILVKNMRRSRIGRTRFRSGMNRSSYGNRRGFYYSRSSVPLKGPIAVVFSIGMMLFILSFAFNFVYIFTTDEFNPIFFFIPFGIIIILIATMMIVSFFNMFKAIKNQKTNPQQPNVTNPNPLARNLNTDVNIFQMAQEVGLKVTFLPSKDPSTAQGLILTNKLTILVKTLTSFETYQNGMVQDLSKGLATYQAQEAWLIQQPATFIDNDLNFARFYNVQLLTLEQANAKLTTFITPKVNQGQ